METPDIEEELEASPLLGISLSSEKLCLRSGKREYTSVLMSEGQRTRNGWTSTVSLGEASALAGTKTGLKCPRGFLSCSRSRST
jgi:hypothetical protein